MRPGGPELPGAGPLGRAFVVGLAVLVLAACRSPELEAFGKRPAPIVVDFLLPPGLSGADLMRSEYGDALRARLAEYATVVPAGEAAPPSSAELRVTVTRIRAREAPSPGAVGLAAGAVVGVLSSAAGNRDAFFDGLFWGLFAANSADARDWDEGRLGYAPVRVSAEVSLRQDGSKRPLLGFTVTGGEVREWMEPLGPEARCDAARIREEEAKAFARAVVDRLRTRLHWLPLAGSPAP